ncbi:MAG: response regulator [Candidatus Omnitrophica bacterium]|nr:response regulator [Candidatus Omnitrophota bacterium]MBU3933776.1 response regulator [Candidatus Omnitrophota bacterium]MBU4140648.1 response regulator [Candidatus Omnitrophota bacterium]
MAKKRILIVDDDPDILDVLRLTIPTEEYEVVEAHDGQEALDKVYERPPDLIILDYIIPKIDGRKVCQKLKKDILLRHMPIIMLTGKGDVKDKVEGLDAGADDYIVKPFEPEELLARIRMTLRRSQMDLDAAPLTRLPGNVSIFNEIDRRIKSGEKFAVGYVDLDKFKTFNDKYGFTWGDRIIQESARVVVKAVEEKDNPEDFVGHIGGDDFVIITGLKAIDQICRQIIKEFDKATKGLYSPGDQKRGYITGKDRQGKTVKVGLISISIGVVTNEHRKFTHVAQVAEIGAELKEYAKKQKGNTYVKDKRGAQGEI